MSDIVATLDTKSELEPTLEIQEAQLKKIKAKKLELKKFNEEAAEKLVEVKKSFDSHVKLIDKIQDDLSFIHKAIKGLEDYYSN